MNENTEDKSRQILGKVYPHSPFLPHDPCVGLYMVGFDFTTPYEYTGWRDESDSWKKTAYLNGTLNPTPTYKIKGPDTFRFLKDTCVNSFEKFPVGMGKHGIMCNGDGLVVQDGVMIRTGTDEVITYWMAPYIVYAHMKGNYNVQGEDLTGKVFLFQLAGPRSLEILEAAAEENLHDIEFMNHRSATIRGRSVRVLRMGMAGSLAYEIHGNIEDACEVYDTIYKAGEAFGIRKLGHHTYMLNHTENGFPQAYYHFPYPWKEDSGFVEFLNKIGGGLGFGANLLGSMGDDIRLRYRNPVELGWDKMIKIDHDFVGREALEKEVANPKRKMVTLKWNVEDIMDVHLSQYQPGEPYAPMDQPNDLVYTSDANSLAYHADRVLKNGEVVGISSGRAYTYFYRDVISLCSIDTAHSAMGTEVIVLWGDPGTRQKEIRAKVSRFPYLDDNRNQDVDVGKIPVFTTKK